MNRSGKLSKKSYYPSFVCEICNISCTSASQLDGHFKGVKHQLQELQEIKTLKYGGLSTYKRSRSPPYGGDNYYNDRDGHPSYYSSRYRRSSRSGHPNQKRQNRFSKYKAFHGKDKGKDKSSPTHSSSKISEDDSILIASCDSSDNEDATCVPGTEKQDKNEKSVEVKTERCPSEKSDFELQDVEYTAFALQSKADVFEFLRNFEVADKSDVAFIKEVKYLFSDALRKYRGDYLHDKECFGTEPGSKGIAVKETRSRSRTNSGSRSVSISTQPLHTSDKHTDVKHKKKSHSHSLSRSSSSERVRSTSRSSLRITIKSDNAGTKSDNKELPVGNVSEVDTMENTELIDRATSRPSLEDSNNTEMNQSVANDTTGCLTAEAASSDDDL